jgi:hypothetical protein
MRKKRAFSLLEVVVAVIIASGACLYLLEFETILISRSKHSLEKLEVEQMKQQAYVKLFENLYTNTIPWKTVIEGKEFTIDLEAPSSRKWKALWKFSFLKAPEMLEPPIALVEAQLILQQGEAQYEDKEQKFKLFLKQELGGIGST